MDTTASVISRIESGQRATSARTLKKLADALEARAVLGFQFGSDADPSTSLWCCETHKGSSIDSPPTLCGSESET